MIRIAEIQDKLFSLIGWQQNYDTADLKIADYLTKSESGVYYQQVHPLLTLENIASIAPDFKNTVYPEYSPEKDYAKGNIVSKDSILYKAVENSKGVTPGSDSSYWLITDPLSEWLANKTSASIAHAISRFITEKLSEKTARALCENKALFDGTGRISDTIPNKNNLVGFEIVPARSRGVTTRINRIGLQFTEPGEYKLYLLHSSAEEPIKVITLNKVRKNSIEWFDIDDLYLPYLSSNNDAGGSWYLCYLQSELPAKSQAIRKDIDWSKGPCPSCSRVAYASWQAWSRYLEVHPFYISEDLIPVVEDDYIDSAVRLWDISNNIYTYNTNYGLNLEVTVGCDITDFIIEQRSLFTDILAKQLAVDMLREFAFNANVRTNRHSINASRLDILYELDGDSSSMKKSGLNYQLDLAFKAIKLNTSGIDRICLPCKNNGIKIITI